MKKMIALGAMLLGLTALGNIFSVGVPELPQPLNAEKIELEAWKNAAASVVALTPGEKSLAPYQGTFRIAKHGSNLYLFFYIDTLGRLPEAKAIERDDAVWQDDAVEFMISVNGKNLHLLVNSQGTFADLIDGRLHENMPWRIVAEVIGTEYAAADSARGFQMQAILDLDAAGVGVPPDGGIIGLQVALDLTGQNPAAVWAPWVDFQMGAPTGRAVWNGKTGGVIQVRREGVEQLSLAGTLADASLTVTQPATESAVHNLNGSFQESVLLQSGRSYSLVLQAPEYYWSCEGVLATPGQFQAAPNPSRRSFFVEVPAQDSVAGIKLEMRQSDHVVWERKLTPAELKKRQRLQIAYDSMAPGTVEFRALDLADQSVLGVKSMRVPQAPQWETFAMPEDTKRIPEGFAPVRYHDGVISVWNREIRLGPGGLIEQISSDGRDLLAAPINLTGMVHDQDLTWTWGAWEVISQSEETIALAAVARSHSGLTMKVGLSLDFDGFLWSSVQLIPDSGPVTLQDFSLRVPLNPSMATLFVQASSPDNSNVSDFDAMQISGNIPPQGYSCGYVPFFYIGTPEVGLEWCSEGRAGWITRNPQELLQIRREASATEFAVHIIQGSHTFDQIRNYEFGLQIAPVKPQVERVGAPRLIIQTMGNNAPYQENSAVEIYAAKSDWQNTGRIALEFRSDHPDRDVELIRLQDGSSINPALGVWWNPQTGYALIRSNDGKILFSASGAKAFKDAAFNQLILEYRPGLVKMTLNGQEIGQQNVTLPLPNWGHMFPSYVLGSPGVSLKSWELSNADRVFHQVNKLNGDPTLLRWVSPEIGYLESPGYLSGVWNYADGILSAQAVPARTYGEYCKSLGYDGTIGFYWAKTQLGHGGAADPEQFQRDNRYAQSIGLSCGFYLADGTCDMLPEYEDYKWEFNYTGPEAEPKPNWLAAGQKFYSGPPSLSNYKSFLYNLENLLKLDARGVYLDGIAYALCGACPTRRPDTNPLVSEPVSDPDSGLEVPVIKIREHRKMMWDMARLIAKYAPQGIIDMHNSNGHTLATMAMATNVTSGELLGLFPERWRELVTPAIFRAEFSGRRAGFTGEALFYFNDPVPPEFGMALALIHGQFPRANWGMHPNRGAALWQLMDEHEFTASNFIAYWEHELTRANSQEVLSSIFFSDKSVLLMLVNWSDTEWSGAIDFSAGVQRWTLDDDFIRLNDNTPHTLNAGRLEVTLRPYELNLYLWEKE